MDNYFRYVGQKCPICEKEFDGNDDIVVCPLCGTPHHRDCYKKNGECGNFEEHSKGFRWSPIETQTPPIEEQPSQPINNGYQQSVPNGFVGVMQNPLSLFPKEMEEGVDTEEVAEFVQVNAFKYIQNFFYAKSKKKTFSWAAFLFAPYWFFYRKLHKIGAIFMAVMILMSVGFSLPKASQDFSNDLYEWAVENQEVTPPQTEKDMQEFMDDYTESFTAVFKNNPIGTALYFIQIAILLAMHLFAGFKANELYYKHTIKNIRQIKTETQDPNQQKLLFFKKGGISASATIIAVLGYEIVIALVNYLFQYI